MPIIDAIAAIDKPKSGKRSAKSNFKYTRDELETMNIGQLRKQVTALIPISDRNGIIPNMAKKQELIDLLMNCKG